MIDSFKKAILEVGLKLGARLKRILREDQEKSKIIRLETEKTSKGNVLISYLTEPFLNNNEHLIYAHTSFLETKLIAQTFLNIGYCVDVIHHKNNRFIPQKDYSFFIDTSSNLERVGPLLSDNCIKILHIIWAHWMFHNYAEYKRHLELKQRRGVALSPVRQMSPRRAIEIADYATIMGNDFTAGTYAYSGKTIYRIPQAVSVNYPFLERTYEACKNNYLWFGGYGAVHKGLDLVLEVFAGLPDYHLYVCGTTHEEKAFKREYHNELFKSPNIHTIGWVDIRSDPFIDIASKCIGMIHPSCSEGGTHSVLTCMHAGLIPIVSYESGVDVFDFGVILKDCSIDKIRSAVHMVSSFPAEKLKSMSRKAWQYTRANHTRERFAEEYSNAVNEIIEKHFSQK
jgi:glycosyltransferase involved in cell wall biosynthesis